ncbi:MAG: universal stress protein, partial [Ignavibacteriales bacterium]|nr:universal stress protein [Ignavibacteriales bacterium]
MKAPQTILVPTDLSAYSLSALQYAVEIAKLFQAKITVLHICEHKKP